MPTLDLPTLIPGAKYFSCYGVDDAGNCLCGKSNCDSPGKHPATRNGFYAATADPKELAELLRRCPTNANLAMATGARSGGIFVVDIDPENDPNAPRNFIRIVRETKQSLETVIAQSGSGGEHYYFRAPEGVKVCSKNGWRPGIDVKADGGYIIVPPSRNAKGEYAYLPGYGPNEKQIVEVVPALLELLSPPKTKTSTNLPAVVASDQPQNLVQAKLYLSKIPPAEEGERNNTAFNVAGHLAAFGLSPETVIELLQPWNALSESPLDDTELHRCVESAFKNGTPREPKRPLHLRNDEGTSNLFVEQHGEDILYCKKLGWLIYDGKRYREDEKDEIYRRAVSTTYSLLLKASEIEDEGDRLRAIRFAIESQNYRRVVSVIKATRSKRPATLDQLDKDAYLLNFPNGTVELGTGKLREHRREDLITKICAADYPTWSDEEYREQLQRSKWFACINQAFKSNSKLVEYFQKACGVSLIGKQLEQMVFLCVGTGNNGKTTYLNAFQSALGDYAMQSMQGFLSAARSGAHPTEQADLQGKRLVVIDEQDDDTRIDEALLKALTGGGKRRARKVCKDSFEFEQSHSLWMLVNQKPEIRGTDIATWRRIAVIPFAVAISESEVNKHLPEELEPEFGLILRWAVEGCQLYLRDNGLTAPDEVKQASESYRREQDTLGVYLEDYCECGEDYVTRLSALFADFKVVMAERGTYAGGVKRFSARLESRGFKKERDEDNNVAFIGLRLRDPKEVADCINNKLVKMIEDAWCQNIDIALVTKCFLNSDKIEVQDVQAWLCCYDRTEAESRLGQLVRYGALVRRDKFYRKTSAFVNFLEKVSTGEIKIELKGRTFES